MRAKVGISEKQSETTDQGSGQEQDDGRESVLGQGLGSGLAQGPGLGGVSMGVSMLGDDLENDMNMDLDHSTGGLGGSSDYGMTAQTLKNNGVSGGSREYDGAGGSNGVGSSGGGGGGSGMIRPRPPPLQTTQPSTTTSHTQSTIGNTYPGTGSSSGNGSGSGAHTGSSGSGPGLGSGLGSGPGRGSTTPSNPVSPSVMATAAWPQTHDSNHNNDKKTPVFNFDFPSHQEGENRHSGGNGIGRHSGGSSGGSGSGDHTGLSSSSKKSRANRGSVSVIAGSEPAPFTYPPNDVPVAVAMSGVHISGKVDISTNSGRLIITRLITTTLLILSLFTALSYVHMSLMITGYRTHPISFSPFSTHP